MNSTLPGNPFLWPILLLLFGGSSVSCGQDNLGSVWNGGGGDEEDGDGDGGVTTHDPAPPVAWFDHAVIESGAPQVVAMEPGGNYSTEVDTQSPVLIWFNESLNPDSVTTSSVSVRLKDTGAKIVSSVETLSHGRCIALTPTPALSADQEYEVFATFGLHDLDGELVTNLDELVLGTFRTSATPAALSPRVVAAFPPNGIEHPTDTIPVIAFSHQMKPGDVIAFLKVHPSQADGNPVDPASGSAQFQEAEDISNFQIWQFNLPTDDAEGAFVADSFFGFRLTETNGVTNAIEDFLGESISSLPTDSFWGTQPFLRPGGMDTYQSAVPDPATEIEADVNSGNIASFQVGVTLGEARVAAVFDVTTRISEQRASNTNLGVASATVTENGWVYSADFRDSLEFVLELLDEAILPDGNLTIGAFVSNNGQRSSVRLLTRDDFWVFDEAVQDTVPPTLGLAQGMGPPFFSGEQKTFFTDLSEFRPFGLASEPISRVTLTAFGDADFNEIPDRLDEGGDIPPTRSGFPYSSGWFLGPYLPNTGFLGGNETFPFALQLTDAVGNVGVEIGDLELELVGFSAPEISGNPLVITAFDAQTLAPVSVRVQVGDDEMTSISERVNTVSNWDNTQILTLVNPFYRTTTLYHLSAGTVSIPLQRLTPSFTSMAPSFDLNGLATEGDVLLGHSGFLNDDGSAFRPTSTWTGETPPDSGGGFGGSVELIDSTRPAWSAAFVDVENSGIYDDDFTMDPRRILEPPSTRASSSNAPDWTFGDGSGGVQDITSFRGSEDIFSTWVNPGPFVFSGARSPNNSEIYPMTFLPGIKGKSLLGFESSNLEVELRPEAIAIAAYEGGVDFEYDHPEDFSFVLEESVIGLASGWVRDGLDLNQTPIWDTSVDPPVALLSNAISAAAPTFTLGFTDVLGISHSTGVYCFQLGEDNPSSGFTEWTWDIWVMDGGTVGNIFTLPDLSDSENQLFGPLSTVPGTFWSVLSETWEITGWDPSTGFFFTDLARTAVGWGQHISMADIEL